MLIETHERTDRPQKTYNKRRTQPVRPRAIAMPRTSKTPLFPVAISPARAGEVLGVRLEKVHDAIREGALPCYQLGAKRRVLIADLVEWVRTWPKG
jgi:excisionase family DNA binding protein